MNAQEGGSLIIVQSCAKSENVGFHVVTERMNSNGKLVFQSVIGAAGFASKHQETSLVNAREGSSPIIVQSCAKRPNVFNELSSEKLRSCP